VEEESAGVSAWEALEKGPTGIAVHGRSLAFIALVPQRCFRADAPTPRYADAVFPGAPAGKDSAPQRFIRALLTA
jgi:hypothetical protein